MAPMATSQNKATKINKCKIPPAVAHDPSGAAKISRYQQASEQVTDNTRQSRCGTYCGSP